MENISPTMEEQKRVVVIQKVFRAELTMGKASLVLGVSERQCYRIKARVKQEGVKGVVHGNRGRPCERKVAQRTVERIVELAKGKYRGFNDHHLTEKLEEEEEIKFSPIARTPIRESMFMCCSMARWSFSTTRRKSPGSILKQRTHLAYIELTASGKGSAMDLFPLNQLKPMNSHPDIITLPLT